MIHVGDRFGRCIVVSFWCDEFGMAIAVVGIRIRRGWTAEDALTRPVRTYGITEATS